jgi:uncharacterized protein (TIGR00730 family)
MHMAAARDLGAAIAERGWGLVYGGAGVGLMGAVADAALAAGGEVHGVIPQFMVARELAHTGLTNLHIVETMHERKARMGDLSHAFVGLPGGFGTLDETFEVLTWCQVGLHAKPIALLDVAGYWQPLARWVERAVEDGYVSSEHAALLRIEADIDDLLDGFRW